VWWNSVPPAPPSELAMHEIQDVESSLPAAAKATLNLDSGDAWEIFRLLDHNHDGMLSAEEWGAEA